MLMKSDFRFLSLFAGTVIVILLIWGIIAFVVYHFVSKFW